MMHRVVRPVYDRSRTSAVLTKTRQWALGGLYAQSTANTVPPGVYRRENIQPAPKTYGVWHVTAHTVH